MHSERSQDPIRAFSVPGVVNFDFVLRIRSVQIRIQLRKFAQKVPILCVFKISFF